MASHLDLEEQEQLDQIKHFWNKWGTPITAVAVVVMGGFAAWNGWQFWQQRQAMQAAAMSEAVAVAVEAGDHARVAKAFDDLRSAYAKTAQASQSGLQVAQVALNAGKTDEAKAALQWVADNGHNDGYKATAKLRLAAVLLEAEDWAAAEALLRGSFPAEFQGLAADRLGDALKLQGKNSEAVAAYEQAWKLLDAQSEYRPLVGYKLNALGVATTMEKK